MRARFTAVILMAVATSGQAADERTEPAYETGAPASSRERPEYRFRPLPEDTFKPSEEISEDFPVPFPADI